MLAMACTRAWPLGWHRQYPVRLTVLLVPLLLAVIGCKRVTVQPREALPGEAETQRILVLYTDYRQAMGGKPPPSAEVLKKWAKGLKDLSQRGITDLDQAFVSPRDNLPYVIVTPSGGLGVVVFERKGAEGKRFIGTQQGSVIEIDEAYFRQNVPNPPK
jgi:hypothetical protein